MAPARPVQGTALTRSAGRRRPAPAPIDVMGSRESGLGAGSSHAFGREADFSRPQFPHAAASLARTEGGALRCPSSCRVGRTPFLKTAQERDGRVLPSDRQDVSEPLPAALIHPSILLGVTRVLRADSWLCAWGFGDTVVRGSEPGARPAPSPLCSRPFPSDRFKGSDTCINSLTPSTSLCSTKNKRYSHLGNSESARQTSLPACLRSNLLAK